MTGEQRKIYLHQASGGLLRFRTRGLSHGGINHSEADSEERGTEDGVRPLGCFGDQFLHHDIQHRTGRKLRRYGSAAMIGCEARIVSTVPMGSTTPDRTPPTNAVPKRNRYPEHCPVRHVRSVCEGMRCELRGGPR